MKTFKEIEAFIRKAMENNFAVHRNIHKCITVVNNDISISFTLWDDNTLYINSCSNWSHPLVLTERELKELDILILDVAEYENSRVIDIFNNFFKEDPNKLTTIDELQDE